MGESSMSCVVNDLDVGVHAMTPAEVGDTTPSNIDNGDAGRSGAAIGNSACGSNAVVLRGATKNGLMGERGVRGGPGERIARRENGDVVFGLQTDCGRMMVGLVGYTLEVVLRDVRGAVQEVAARGGCHEMLSALGRGRASCGIA
jgi:hypothetical protein